MALIQIFLLFCSVSFSLSGFDFVEVDNEQFNKSFFKKQILWDIKQFAPQLLTNPDFQNELASFIKAEKKSLFLALKTPGVRIPKYFMRAKVKNKISADFEFGFIFTNKPGSVWSSKGVLKNLTLLSSQHSLPEECSKISSIRSEILYFEHNKKTSECSRFSLYLSGHPLGLFHIEETTNTQKKAFYLSPRVLYPSMIKHGIPPLYFILRKEWRLGISRFTDKKDHSIIYFP